MVRRVLLVIGATLLSVSGIGFIVGLVWLWLSEVQSTPEYVLEARFQVLLYVLPALFLGVAFLGISLMIHTLSSHRKTENETRGLQPHMPGH